MAHEARLSIDERVAGIRRRLGLSEVAFAPFVGVSWNTLVNAELGHLPRAATLGCVVARRRVSVD